MVLLRIIFAILSGVFCAANPDVNNADFLPDSYLSKLNTWNTMQNVVDVFQARKSQQLNSESINIPLDVETLQEISENYNFAHDSFSNISSKCANDLIYILENYDKRWAVQLIDSYGKLSSGLLEGNVNWLGEYHECIKVSAPARKKSTVGNFRGKYCALKWSITVPNNSITTFPLAITTGACIPETCTSAELTPDFLKILSIARSIPKIGKYASMVNITSMDCQPLEKELNTETIAVISLICFLTLLAVIGSLLTTYEYLKSIINTPHGFIYDSSNNINSDIDPLRAESVRKASVSDDSILLLEHSKSSRWLKCVKNFFKCFCVFTNGAKILNTDSREGQLLSIHGIRFLSMSWVILGHIYAFSFQSIRNPIEAFSLIDNLPFQIVMQGFYSVDSFFLLSGFLVTYIFLNGISKREIKMSWGYFYLHRYIRLTPVYMIVLGFSATVPIYMGSGPLWPNGNLDLNCKNYWWWNLLYINNFLKTTDMCMAWSWYLANDMQFYVISPLMLYSLFRWPKVGISLVVTLLCSSWLANFFLTYCNNLVPGVAIIFHQTDIQSFLIRFTDYFEKLYVKPYTRISPYLIGMLLGYILYKIKLNTKPLNLLQLVVGWSFASATTLACVYGLYHADPSLLASSFYNALNRTSFSIGLAWVIYVCLSGQGGFINTILSYKVFIPLSRLTYCAYLVHPIVIVYYYQSLTVPLQFSQMTMVTLFIGLMVISYGFAFLTALLFESPVMALEKLVMKEFKR